MDAYIKVGVDEEIIVVIRGYDNGLIEALINRLSSSRTKEIKEIASKLEEDFNDNSIRRSTIKTKSKN
jgi:hypothetical protein